MDIPHQTTKECLIRNFQEQLDSEETFTAINYRSLFNIATDMIIVLYYNTTYFFWSFLTK